MLDFLKAKGEDAEKASKTPPQPGSRSVAASASASAPASAPASSSASRPASKPKHWSLSLLDVAIALLSKLVTWGVIAAIAVFDVLAVAVTLIIAFQDDLPVFVVDFVKEYVFASQKHIRLRLEMLNLDGIADLMRDGLKALGLLWGLVMLLTLGASVVTRYVWAARTRKKTESDSRLSGKVAPGEVLVPLHDPLMLQMDDEFSRYAHLYAFYLDLRCRSPEDASRVAQAMDSLKATLSAELVKLAEGKVVQVKRDAAIDAMSEAARAVTGGGIVGVILRSSDYHRLRKPESAQIKTAAPGEKPRVKLSTSWGAKPYTDVAAGGGAASAAAGAAPVAPAAATAAGAAAPAAAPAQAAAAEAPAEPPPTIKIDTASLVAEKARDVLAGLRG